MSQTIKLSVSELRNRVGLNVSQQRESVPLSIEQVRIIRENIKEVYADTTEAWNNQVTLVPKRGDIIIYLDRNRIEDDVGNVEFVPGIKIGDGNAYVADLPFIDDALAIRLSEHAQNMDIHITPEERNFWNNKLNYNLNGETLNLNRN